MYHKIVRDNTGLMKTGQDLVVAGFAGLAGTRIIAEMKREDLRSRFAGRYLDLLINSGESGSGEEEEKSGLRDWKGLGAAEWEPAGEGGILTAIWNLSGTYGLGAEFSLRRIPVKQASIEICEFFALNPYRLYSKGCWLLASENGGRIARDLREQGIGAEVIGSITKGIARVITDGEEKGFLNRPQPDELGKVIPDWQEKYF